MPEDSLPAPHLISTVSGLKALAQTLQKQPRLAVDTEANSLYAYRERVCLLQFSIPGADYLVDPLALPTLEPLDPVFASPEIEKVFHAADYDLYGLSRSFNFRFANLYDTMLAARTLGHEALGLNALVLRYFGIELDKRFQKANWGMRPLTPDLIDYARLDTHYLLALRDRLEEDLRLAERWELAWEDFQRLCQVPLPTSDPRERWERISGQRDLTPRQRTTLHELCLYRERMAEKLDRPLFKVLSDEILLEIARVSPETLPALQEVGLSERQMNRLGRGLLEAIHRSQTAPIVRPTLAERPSESFLQRLQKLKAWRKETAKALGVESDVILPRASLHAIAAENPRSLAALEKIMPDLPWRREKYGLEILHVLGVK